MRSPAGPEVFAGPITAQNSSRRLMIRNMLSVVIKERKFDVYVLECSSIHLNQTKVEIKS